MFFPLYVKFILCHYVSSLMAQIKALYNWKVKFCLIICLFEVTDFANLCMELVKDLTSFPAHETKLVKTAKKKRKKILKR